MDDVLNFVNAYKRDYENMHWLALTGKQLRLHPPMDNKEIHRDFGLLLFDGRMEVKRATDKKFKTRYIFGFQCK